MFVLAVVFLAVAAGLLLFASDATPAAADFSGDLDCSQSVDSLDALLVLQDVAGLSNADCVTAGNVDCDADVDSFDALKIFRHVAGLSVDLPEGCPDIGAELIQLDIGFTVDAGVQPSQSEIEGIDGGPPRRLASVADALGNQADFVEDEVLMSTGDGDALQAFLDRWGGEVLRVFDPADYGLGGGAPTYLVRINAARADPSGLEHDLRSLDEGNRGSHTVSGAGGLNLLAAAADEAAAGMAVGVNWVGYGSDLRDGSTTEAPTGPTGYDPDAYTWNYMNTDSVQDIGVTEAWTALTKTGRISNQVTIAVLDGGFAPNADLPAIVSSNGPLNTMAAMSCTGGTPCPWHGTSVVTAAMGIPDNAFGAAGPAGPVARAITYHGSWDIFSGIVGVGVVRAQGASIINMSWGARVPASLSWSVNPFEVATVLVRASGALIFAAAGNDNQNVDATDCFIVCWEEAWHAPCENAGVICVGALAANSTGRASYSNFGSQVDIYAPGTVFTGPDPANPGIAARAVSGTSSASPFAAGVAALIWAANPGLSANGVEEILYDTARPGGSSVQRYVNAWGGVRRALGDNTPPDIDIVTPADGASFSRGSQSVSFSATATDPEDGTPTILWSSDRDGPLGEGALVASTSLSFGTHVITATAWDSGNFTDFETVTINIVDDPPLVEITNPPGGSAFFQGQTINLTGTTLDTNSIPAAPLPGASVAWSVDGGAPFATGHSVTRSGGTLSVGVHTITFTGNEDGLIASDSITVTINPDPPDLPPNVVITSPANNLVFPVDQFDTEWYRQITFMGSATDSEDGPLTGASLVWSKRVGTSGPFTNIGTGTSISHKLYVIDCFGTLYQIRLTATDSGGNPSSHTINVTVNNLC